MTTDSRKLMEEEKHQILEVMVTHPLSYVHAWGASKCQVHEKRGCDEGEESEEKDPMVVVPYVSGLSEDIRRVCRRFGIRTVFQSCMTLQNQLTRVKVRLTKSCVASVLHSLQLWEGLHR